MDPADRVPDAFPDQTAYKFRMDDSDPVTVPALEGGTYRALFYTTDVKLFQFEGEPGARIPWHTHYPNVDAILYCLDGAIRITIERPDDETQSVDLTPGTVGYLPAGARHTMEVTGDAYHRHLVCQSKEPGDLESLVGESATPDVDDWPVSVWVDRVADEVRRLNDDIVET